MERGGELSMPQQPRAHISGMARSDQRGRRVQPPLDQASRRSVGQQRVEQRRIIHLEYTGVFQYTQALASPLPIA
jgi:hypothetical protein